MKITQGFLLLSVLMATSSFATEVPEYQYRVGLEPAAKVPRWLIELTPPKGFHFNLRAPMAVSASAKKIEFNKVLAEPRRLGFSSSEFELKENDPIQTSVFLCDDPKTTCIKKKLDFNLKVNSDLSHFDKPATPISSPEKIKKDPEGFYVNALEPALQESIRTGKPLLIDFFGIWCPPCNLYQETVFPEPEFKKSAKHFVLLKMDADLESSYALKSQFLVGGYPTLVVTQAAKGMDPSQLQEVGRVVGFFPTAELTAKLKLFLSQKQESLDVRIARESESLLKDLKLRLQRAIEEKDEATARKTGERALWLAPDDLELKISMLNVNDLAAPGPKWNDQMRSTLIQVFSQLSQVASPPLFELLQFVLSHEPVVTREWVVRSDDILKELEKRVDPKTLSVAGLECSLSDLYSLGMDRAELLNDQKLTSELRQKTIGAYEKWMSLHPGLDSRGINLELASHLAKAGRGSDARKIYERFIKKYPHEFTFYYAAAKLLLEENDLKGARDYAERAVQFAYGDNLIRSMDRLMKVMKAQGELDFAIKRGDDLLASLNLDPKLKIRTGRYVDQLKSSLTELKKAQKKP